MSSFPFSKLCPELASEILAFAATPNFSQSGGKNPYSTAHALQSTSRTARAMSARHFLHTVSVPSPTSLPTFMEGLKVQLSHRDNRSALQLNYEQLVHRFYADDCPELLAEEPSYGRSSFPGSSLSFGGQQSAAPSFDYEALYKILRNTSTMGLNYNVMHLLYNGLSSYGADPAHDWKCTHITLTGDFIRWRPLTSTSEGAAFLSKITHLTLWISNNVNNERSSSLLPEWASDIPFNMLVNLTHLALPLLEGQVPLRGNDKLKAPSQMLVYSRMSAREVRGYEASRGCAVDPALLDRNLFRTWLRSGDPVRHGVVVPVKIGLSPIRNGGQRGDEDALDWQRAYLEGQSDGIWDAARSLQATTRRR